MSTRHQVAIVALFASLSLSSEALSQPKENSPERSAVNVKAPSHKGSRAEVSLRDDAPENVKVLWAWWKSNKATFVKDADQDIEIARKYLARCRTARIVPVRDGQKPTPSGSIHDELPVVATSKADKEDRISKAREELQKRQDHRDAMLRNATLILPPMVDRVMDGGSEKEADKLPWQEMAVGVIGRTVGFKVLRVLGPTSALVELMVLNPPRLVPIRHANGWWSHEQPASWNFSRQARVVIEGLDTTGWAEQELISKRIGLEIVGRKAVNFDVDGEVLHFQARPFDINPYLVDPENPQTPLPAEKLLPNESGVKRE